ncbi:class I SAM-dependent methyltransferase [Streptomyces sp. GDS52]|uniref:class I SAM-dependent methyltransferase n=1 Tax=unclassified Streptomyces TaxID=2593676 RepID=UPI00364CD6F6
MASSTLSSPPGEPFASTVPYYAAFRPRYAPEFYTLLADRFHLTGSRRVLDLGAGPGTLALDLAPLVGEVIAVDPQKGMLDEGRRLAAEHGITNITWREGDSTLLPAMDLGPVLLTVMGAAYHWMDRDRVARDLDRIIEPGGAIVLASRGAPGDFEPAPWRQVVDEVRARHLGPGRRAGSGACSHPEEPHRDVLARSPFSRVDTARWEHILTRTVDEVLGWVFSLSYSSPARLGAKKDAFEQDLRAALLAFAPSGRFDEVIHTEAVIATRP